VIHFATGSAGWVELMREAGGTVIGVDWRIDLAEARRRLGPTVPVQGNLDPLLLLAPREFLGQRVDQILDKGRGAGHIFNLGHGVLPETSPDQVKFVVERVHAGRG
jgi:uroporphyrinogen decarboxylase